MSKFNCSFEKYNGGPVFGNRETGTMFDAYIWRDRGRLRMDVSWRPKKSLAVTFSDDGVHWDEPQITLGLEDAKDWEQDLNRDCVIKNPNGSGYLMWYTGWDPVKGLFKIGFAISDDGIHFRRYQDNPVLVPETEFEYKAVMNPFVMFEDGKYRMWYAAGETYEPNVICYAESEDGIHWNKYPQNPIFKADPSNEYEQERVGAVQLLKEENGYIMFYIGYRDIDTACVCAARSKDGISGWKRIPENPLVTPTEGTWDEHSCYKPTVIRDENGIYHIWYNGRRFGDEFIGYAYGKIE